jgi:hypothetical protein
MKNGNAGRNLNIAGSFGFLIVFLIILLAGCVSVVCGAYAHQISPEPGEGSIITSTLVRDSVLASKPHEVWGEGGEEIKVAGGMQLPFQSYVTPDDEAVVSLAEDVTCVVEAYELALRWTFVSDQRLTQQADSWLTPHQFLVDTIDYSTNPVPGETVSDCEEQAWTLVSILRAIGTYPQDVRLAIGEVDSGGDTAGHAWVELLVDGEWLVLEATSGPYWDDAKEKLVNRQGVSFDYYESNRYPVNEVWVYCNDVYCLDFETGSGNAPSSWIETRPASYKTP